MSAPLFYPGVAEAAQRVRAMLFKADLLDVIDSLYGRENLPDDATVEQIRDEAVRQVHRDFRNPAGPWDYVETMGKIALAQRRAVR